MGETPYLVKLTYDEGHGPPHDEWDTIFKVEIADGRNYDSSHRARMAACGHCSLTEHFEPVIQLPDGRRLYCDNDEGLDPHEWKPQEDTMYFLEGGHDDYSLVEIGKEPPEDYTDIDGIMELTKRGRDEWEDMTTENRKAIAEGELAEYNSWRKGEVYIVDVCKRLPECEECGHVPEPEVIDTCGGFIGDESVESHVQEILAHELGLPYDQIKEYTHYETEHA